MTKVRKRDWLIKIRKERNFSQAEIAKFVGVTPQMYNYIENNKRSPSTKLAKKIAKIFNFDWTKFYE